MPWHGKLLLDNLRVTFKLWQARQHPSDCPTCREIWGAKKAPTTFDDYCARYPDLDHGAKRHLTMKWSPGLTAAEVAERSGQPLSRVRLAIANNVLRHSVSGKRKYVSRTDATLWVAHRCPTGESRFSWIAVDTAAKRYLFTTREVWQLIAQGALESREGTAGAQRGLTYVRPQQCEQLRKEIGFTEKQAAARLHITVSRLRELLNGLNWRGAPKIPFVTLQAVKKRLDSRAGYDLREAAAELKTTVAWVEEHIAAGTVRVSRAKWDRRRRYLSEPMMERLRQARRSNAKREPASALPADALSVSQAAREAGVSIATIGKWAEASELPRFHTPVGWRYRRRSVRARAKRYWQDVRFLRATPPAWLQSALPSNENS
ncbi:MAG: regulatory protein MerR [Ramlibacter sp.]|jgi:hypothetical protein|nr:regulatory protein MerR [Ramlibacter sp.]